MPESRLAMAMIASALTLVLLACGGGGTEPNASPRATVTVPGSLMVGDTMTVTVQAADAKGKALTGAAIGLSLVTGGAAGSFGPVKEIGHGEYNSTFTGTNVGAPAHVTYRLGDGPVDTSDASVAVVGFIQISISDYHACGVVSNGDAYCWGRGLWGQLGAGDSITSALKPTKVATTLAWQYVGAGADMTCGLTTTGGAYCWGLPMYFSTGTSMPFLNGIPEPIDGTHLFSRLDVGWDAGACGLTTANLPICWGVDGYGQVGNGGASPGAPPTPVVGAPALASIARSLFDGCGITEGGAAYCWGSNETGLLGVADSTLTTTCTGTLCSPIAVAIPGATGLVPSSLSLSTNHACGLKPDGTAYCWGNGGVNNGQASPAVPLATALRFKQLAVGSGFFCGLATDAWTYCWGENQYGQTGTGAPSPQVTVPTRTAGDVKFVRLVAGVTAACGIADDGHAYCWGFNGEGQLGDGTTIDRAAPTLVGSFR